MRHKLFIRRLSFVALLLIFLVLLVGLGPVQGGKKALMKKLLKGALLAQVLRPNFIPVPMPIPFPMQHHHQPHHHHGWSAHQRLYSMPNMHQYYPSPFQYHKPIHSAPSSHVPMYHSYPHHHSSNHHSPLESHVFPTHPLTTTEELLVQDTSSSSLWHVPHLSTPLVLPTSRLSSTSVDLLPSSSAASTDHHSSRPQSRISSTSVYPASSSSPSSSTLKPSQLPIQLQPMFGHPLSDSQQWEPVY